MIDKAQAFTEQGDGNSAIVILEAITSTCADEADDISDYTDPYALTEALDEAWTEAILSADLTEEQQIDLEVMLAERQDALNGSFAMSLEALQQGWDYPPLQQVLQGHITAQGAWAAEPPNFADDLALIRLQILDRQGRDQEYLYLAEAEGQTTQYLTKLAEMGQIAQAVEAAKDQITTPAEAFALAKVLREQEHMPEALEIAQLGLSLPEMRHYELADWTSDIAEGLGEHQAALNARIIAFKIKPSFRDYRLAEHLAGADWKRVKKDLIAALRRYKEWGAEPAKIDIFLHEGLIDDAIAATPNIFSYNIELVYRVMDAAIEPRPEWVLETARRQAETILEQKRSDRYREAIRWLKYVKAAYLQMGQQADWSAYRTQLTTQYGRLRKFMELINQGGLG